MFILLLFLRYRMENNQLRIKQEIEQIDTEVESLYSSACSLTSVYIKELSESLETAFATLIPGIPFSQKSLIF